MQVRVRWLGRASNIDGAEVGVAYEMSEADINQMKQTRRVTLRGQAHQVARWRTMTTFEDKQNKREDILELDIEEPAAGTRAS